MAKASTATGQKTILVVEDEPSLAEVLVKKLTQFGYKVITAEDGHEAIHQATTGKADLILLDVVLPKQNGFDVLQTLRSKYDLKTPVIIVSNLEMEEDIQTGHNLGIVDYIVKSNISLRNLMQLISKTLSTSEA
jgi:DNA-binding response OmpR family regulator